METISGYGVELDVTVDIVQQRVATLTDDQRYRIEGSTRTEHVAL